MKATVQPNIGAAIQVNVSAYDSLTARAAVEAVDIALGSYAHATVYNAKGKTYRVTGSGKSRRARLVHPGR